MIDRRGFIGGNAAALVVAPLTAFGQPAARVPRIGILANTDAPAWDAFRRGLREHGYVDGRNVTIVWRWADGKPDRFRALAEELVRLDVDLIVTSTTAGTFAAKEASGKVPILMLNSAYPDRIGLVESLARPGGNITGYNNVAPELSGKKMQLLKAIVPNIKRLALLWHPAGPVEAHAFRDMEAAAAAFGVQVVTTEASKPEDYPAAFAAIAASRVDALHVAANPVNARGAPAIVEFALKSRLPSSFDERGFVIAGGLLSYGSSFPDTYHNAAVYVDKILKGARPASLPIQQPTRFELVVNLKTARAIGLTIPQSLLLQADEVIE